MDRITFKANININYLKLNEGFAKDKRFIQNSVNRANIYRVLNQIKSFTQMKEDSLVDIQPRIDNNILNLICTVEDKTREVRSVILERSARKIAEEPEFAQRFVSNIKSAIQNVEVVKKDLSRIRQFISNSKTIDETNLTRNLSGYMLEHLQKNNNPTDRIISILKGIEEQFSNEQNIVSLIRNPLVNNSGKHCTYFSLKNAHGEKTIPIALFLKDSVINIFK